MKRDHCTERNRRRQVGWKRNITQIQIRHVIPLQRRYCISKISKYIFFVYSFFLARLFIPLFSAFCRRRPPKTAAALSFFSFSLPFSSRLLNFLPHVRMERERERKREREREREKEREIVWTKRESESDFSSRNWRNSNCWSLQNAFSLSFYLAVSTLILRRRRRHQQQLPRLRPLSLLLDAAAAFSFF
jgi:hypothetical protein